MVSRSPWNGSAGKREASTALNPRSSRGPAKKLHDIVMTMQCSFPRYDGIIRIRLADDAGKRRRAGFLHQIEEPAVLIVFQGLRGRGNFPGAVYTSVPVDDSAVVLGKRAGADYRVARRGNTHEIPHPGAVIPAATLDQRSHVGKSREVPGDIVRPSSVQHDQAEIFRMLGTGGGLDGCRGRGSPCHSRQKAVEITMLATSRRTTVPIGSKRPLDGR